MKPPRSRPPRYDAVYFEGTAALNEASAVETNYWQTTDLPSERIASILGADHVAWVRSQKHAAAVCDSRAAGSWQANASESYCAYRSLAAHIRAAR